MAGRILVIDNDDDVLEMLQEVLVYEGYEAITTKSTDDIITTVQQYHPDVLLVDYLLDGINGGELCSQVKKNQDTCQLPVVIISAYPRVLHSLGTYNCNVFLPKPFDIAQLTNIINNLIQSSNTNFCQQHVQ